MPMQINVGFSEKKGQPDFGSIGASVNLQLELEGSLVNDPSRLRDSIRRLFGEARDAVQEELARDGTNGHTEEAPARNGGPFWMATDRISAPIGVCPEAKKSSSPSGDQIGVCPPLLDTRILLPRSG